MIKRFRFALVLIGTAGGCRGETRSASERKAAAPTAPAPVAPPPSTTFAPLPAESTPSKGPLTWVRTVGGSGEVRVRGLASHGKSLVAAGHFEGELGLASTVTSAGEADAFVTMWGPDGTLAWSRTWGALRDDTATAVATTVDSVVVVGNFLDALNVDGVARKSGGSDDGFVVALSDQGETKWTFTFGGPDSDGANGVASVPGDGWVVVGSYAPGAAFGGEPLGTQGGTDAFMLRLAPDGAVRWAKTFGGRDRDTFHHVALDQNGAIYALGRTSEQSNFGGADLVPKGGHDYDVVLAKYSASGDHVWSQRFGEAFNEIAGGLAVDGAGHVTIVGSFDIELPLGQKKFVSKGESDAFIARFDTNGQLLWADAWGGAREDVASAVAVDGFGNAVVTGWFWGPVSLGARAWPGKGNADGFVRAFAADGSSRWFHTFGDRDFDFATAVTMNGPQAVVAGEFRVSLGLGDKPIVATPGASKLPTADAVIFAVGP